LQLNTIAPIFDSPKKRKYQGDKMKFVKMSALVLFIASVVFAQTEEPKKIELKTFTDSVSYSIGRNIGRNLHDPSININFDMCYQGMKDVLSGTTLLTDEVVQKILVKFNQQLMAEKAKQQGAVKEKNKKEGDAFLTANKTKEGVKTLEDGLQYKVITTGNGPSPKKEDTVKVHYKGTLIDGREFDSSYGRGEPTEFPVNRVIPGWTEALQLMHVGDKWELYIPSELAYGDNGAGEMIEPGCVLVFQVELLEIKPKAE